MLEKFTNSNRSGHLTAAVLGGAGFAALGLWSGNIWLFKAGLWCPGYEALMSCDMDHHARGLSGDWTRKLWVVYWKPYAWIVPHRSDFSHSLLLGTPIRILYSAIAPTALWLAWMYFVRDIHPMTFWVWITQNWQNFFKWAWMFKWFWIGGLMADFIHLCKDGYPWKYGIGGVIFGRDLSRKLFKTKKRKSYKMRKQWRR